MLGCGIAQAVVYPLKVSSSNPRILVDQRNVPFLMVGDSPHSLVVNLSEADAMQYLADRSKRGFNSLWVEVLCNPYTGGRPNASTIGGIVPFTNTVSGTTNYDLTAPNPAYFALVDRIVKLAGSYGLLVVLDPIDTGGWLEGTSGGNPDMIANGEARCLAYGEFLGKRYKNFPNILWMNGNDFQSWQTPSHDALVEEVAKGIKQFDTNHLQTIELNYFVSSSFDDTNWAAIANVNSAYTYSPTYAEVLHAYGQSSNAPVIMAEANYESETNPTTDGGSPHNLRLQEYWTMLSGASGQLYGNHYTWTFISGWQNHLATPGVQQLGYMRTLFASRAWYNLAPDIGHTVVTAGYGTFSGSGSIDSNDYATAASTPDGTLAMVYLPTVRTVTVNMASLAGPVMARWFDPSSGTYSVISGSPFSNAGSQTFTPPGSNSAGDGDWVLLLELPPPAAGTYNGLFNSLGMVEQVSQGLITTSLTAQGKYTGRLQIGAGRYSFSGALSPEGRITNVISRKTAGNLALNLGFAGGDAGDQMSGEITNGTAWTATVLADRAVFNARTNPAPYANFYTLRFPGQSGDPTLPAGDGFGTATVGAGGMVTFAGTLADGNIVSQSVPVSQAGTWPLYVPMYSGGGSIWSWLVFANQTNSDVTGTLEWIKPAMDGARYYPSGFTNSGVPASGSAYSATADGRVLALTNATLEFSGGNVATGFTKPFAFGPRGHVFTLGATNRLSMVVGLSSGRFSGSVRDPSSGRTWNFQGVVLQKPGAGYGFLLGTNQSSDVVLAQ